MPPSRELPPPPAPAAQAYRPVSALALTGLVFSLFAPLVFLIQALWFLILSPGIGLILCVIARWRIHQSQGTLGGEAVATVGLLLSVGCGLGWVTTQATEQFLLAQEAETFLHDWLDTLQKPEKEGEAFLGTIDPKRRQINFNPNDLRRMRAHFPPVKGTNTPEIDLFRTHPFTMLVQRYRGKIQLVPKGRLGGVIYNQGNYEVKYAYQLTCPVLEGEVVFKLLSDTVNTPQGPRREWRVLVTGGEPNLPKELTSYGQTLQIVQAEAQKRFNEVMQRIHHNKIEELKDYFAPDSQTGQKELVNFLRPKGLPSEAESLWQTCGTLLIGDEQTGPNGWKLRYRIQVVTAKQDMEFEASMTTPDLRKPETWRLSEYKRLSFRKRREMEGPATPTGPDTSEMMGKLPR
jgi:hypothetical protein